jgi:hypothetical protein
MSIYNDDVFVPASFPKAIGIGLSQLFLYQKIKNQAVAT